MAEPPRGPVKPPTIDLKAKEAEKAKTGTGPADAKPSEPAKTQSAPPKGGQSGPDKTDAAKPGAQAAGAQVSGAKTAPGKSEPGPKPETDKAKGEPATGAKPDAAKKPDAGKNPNAGKKPGNGGAVVAGLLGVVGGGVLGLGLAYGLATQGYWPNPGAQPASQAELSALSQKLGGEIAALKSETDGAIGALKDETAGLQTRLQGVQQTPVPTVDLDPLTNDISGLKTALGDLTSRVDALSLGAEAKPNSQVPEALTQLRADLKNLSDKVGVLEAGAQGTTGEIADLGAQTKSLSSELGVLKSDYAALKDQADRTAKAAAKAPAMLATQVPLAVSGLSNALRTGLPYSGELAVLKAALPGLSVPETVAENADQGLPDPAVLRQTLQANVPAMLKAKPVAADASWQQKAMDKVTALLALQPTGPVEGSGPDAVLTRLEAALKNGDLGKASTLFGQLPAPMQAASGVSAASLSALAEAEAFARSVRAQALKPQGEGTS